MALRIRLPQQRQEPYLHLSGSIRAQVSAPLSRLTVSSRSLVLQEPKMSIALLLDWLQFLWKSNFSFIEMPSYKPYSKN